MMGAAGATGAVGVWPGVGVRPAVVAETVPGGGLDGVAGMPPMAATRSPRAMAVRLALVKLMPVKEGMAKDEVASEAGELSSRLTRG